MRILCIDIGSKRIGIAASDPLGLIAQPIEVVIRKGGVRDFDLIIDICRKLETKLIVVGLPLDAEGRVGSQAEKVEAFVARFKKQMSSVGLDLPIEFWDERYSTATAEVRLIEADVSRSRRQEVIDKMAAVVILEDYLKAHEPIEVNECTEG